MHLSGGVIRTSNQLGKVPLVRKRSSYKLQWSVSGELSQLQTSVYRAYAIMPLYFFTDTLPNLLCTDLGSWALSLRPKELLLNRRYINDTITSGMFTMKFPIDNALTPVCIFKFVMLEQHDISRVLPVA